MYNENDEVIDNNNAPEWDSDEDLTSAFMAVSDLYDSFFIDNEKEFKYIGPSNEKDILKLQDLFKTAMLILEEKNNGKYIIQNDVSFDSLWS